MALAVVVIIVVGLLYALKTEHDENLMRTIKARQELDQRAVEGFDR
jgi:septation ring formation regulator EzrA